MRIRRQASLSTGRRYAAANLAVSGVQTSAEIRKARLGSLRYALAGQHEAGDLMIYSAGENAGLGPPPDITQGVTWHEARRSPGNGIMVDVKDRSEIPGSRVPLRHIEVTAIKHSMSSRIDTQKSHPNDQQ